MKPLIVAITLLMTAFPYRAAQNESKPPAEISVTLLLEAATVKVGSAVSIRTVLSNNSNQIFDASACYCGPAGLDSLFRWEVREHGRQAPKKTYPHPELATGQPILDRLVRPGGELSGSQDVSRLYDMTKPGVYKIQVTVELPKQMGGGVVKSNEVAVTVIP